MNALKKLKTAVYWLMGVEGPREECGSCKLLEQVIAERDELIAQINARPEPENERMLALKGRQVKAAEILRPRYRMFYVTIGLLSVTLLCVLKNRWLTAFRSLSEPLPGDARIVQFVIHKKHMLLGVVLHSESYAEILPDDPVPVLDLQVVGHDAEEIKLDKLLAPSVN